MSEKWRYQDRTFEVVTNSPDLMANLLSFSFSKSPPQAQIFQTIFLYPEMKKVKVEKKTLSQYIYHRGVRFRCSSFKTQTALARDEIYRAT